MLAWCCSTLCGSWVCARPNVGVVLQHSVWILGLRPAQGGSLKPVSGQDQTSNTVLTTAVLSDLPVLSAMLSRLFESSQ